MSAIFAVAAAASVAFSDYPGVLSRNQPIEATIDKGLVVEIIVRCGGRSAGILTYSKVDRLFCDSALRCHSRLAAARRATCDGGDAPPRLK